MLLFTDGRYGTGVRVRPSAPPIGSRVRVRAHARARRVVRKFPRSGYSEPGSLTRLSAPERECWYARYRLSWNIDSWSRRLWCVNQIVGPFRFQNLGSPSWTRTGDWAVNAQRPPRGMSRHALSLTTQSTVRIRKPGPRFSECEMATICLTHRDTEVAW